MQPGRLGPVEEAKVAGVQQARSTATPTLALDKMRRMAAFSKGYRPVRQIDPGVDRAAHDRVPLNTSVRESI